MVNIDSNRAKILDRFTKELRDQLGQSILALYLFGSVAKGSANPGSDIDVLVIYSGISERALLEAAADISFRIACEHGELIETIPMSKEEYDQSLGRSPFLWEVLKFGTPFYTILRGTEWELDFRDYLSLAQEFLGYARDALKEGKLRLVIDSGYNASELLVKALIISTKEPLASSHGGIVGQFGKLFVLTGIFDQQTGRNLNLSLDLRGKARYKPGAQLSRSDAEIVISLA